MHYEYVYAQKRGFKKNNKGGLEANEYSILNNLKIPENVKEIFEPYY